MLLQVTNVANQIAQQQNVKFEVPSDITIFLVGVVVALVFLLMAIVVSNAIYNESGTNHKDIRKRRMWFWIFGVFTLIIAFVLLYFVFQPDSVVDLKNAGVNMLPTEKNAYELSCSHYSKMCPIATVVSFVLYVTLGFIISKMFKTKKVGNWF